MTVERISAVTLRVASMKTSLRFYREVVGMEAIYGGENGCFSSLRSADAKGPILNLEQGYPVTHWGRMIFYGAEVDTFWASLRGKGFHPQTLRDGERYFHMSDPDGHELSFAYPVGTPSVSL